MNELNIINKSPESDAFLSFFLIILYKAGLCIDTTCVMHNSTIPILFCMFCIFLINFDYVVIFLVILVYFIHFFHFL